MRTKQDLHMMMRYLVELASIPQSQIMFHDEIALIIGAVQLYIKYGV